MSSSRHQPLEEQVQAWVPRDDAPSPPRKLHKSRHPPTLPPTGSTFGLLSTSAKVTPDDPGAQPKRQPRAPRPGPPSLQTSRFLGPLQSAPDREGREEQESRQPPLPPPRRPPQPRLKRYALLTSLRTAQRQAAIPRPEALPRPRSSRPPAEEPTGREAAGRLAAAGETRGRWPLLTQPAPKNQKPSPRRSWARCRSISRGCRPKPNSASRTAKPRRASKQSATARSKQQTCNSTPD